MRPSNFRVLIATVAFLAVQFVSTKRPAACLSEHCLAPTAKG